MDFASHAPRAFSMLLGHGYAPRAWFTLHSHAIGMLAMRPMHPKMQVASVFSCFCFR